jgi:hypothetical protein
VLPWPRGPAQPTKLTVSRRRKARLTWRYNEGLRRTVTPSFAGGGSHVNAERRRTEGVSAWDALARSVANMPMRAAQTSSSTWRRAWRGTGAYESAGGEVKGLVGSPRGHPRLRASPFLGTPQGQGHHRS